MQTLIFNGSTRKNGDTEALINALVSSLCGEIKIVSSYNSNISPCVDCRYCWNNEGCAIDDEMQDIYKFLVTCDNIVLASPIWFSSLSGPLLNMISRFQAIWAADAFQKKKQLLNAKKGVIIVVGARPKTADIPTQIAIGILKHLNVHVPSVEKIYSLNTDSVSAKDDISALEKCEKIASLLNNGLSKTIL